MRVDLASLGAEAEIVPTPGWLVVVVLVYLFTQVLGQPFAMGGLGHGGRAHSPNEYATVKGMRLFARSVARLLDEFARTAGGELTQR